MKTVRLAFTHISWYALYISPCPSLLFLNTLDFSFTVSFLSFHSTDETILHTNSHTVTPLSLSFLNHLHV